MGNFFPSPSSPLTNGGLNRKREYRIFLEIREELEKENPRRHVHSPYNLGLPVAFLEFEVGDHDCDDRFHFGYGKVTADL